MKTFYKTILLLFLNAPFLILNSFSQQAPGIQWQNTIGGSDFENCRSVFSTPDGGYIAGGYSTSNISGDKTEDCIGSYDYWIMKLDSVGAIQWQNTIGGSSYDVLVSMQQTTDGGFILGGSSSSNISGDKTENSIGNVDFWIIKIDSLGIIEWQNTVGGDSDDFCMCIQQTFDGGYICCGYSNSNISGDKTENSFNNSRDWWVVKLSASGTLQWENTIGGTLNDFALCMDQTSDGGYILGGVSESNISGDKTENSMGDDDYWVIKLDSSGAIQWQNTIGGSNADNLNSIQQTSAGGYILGGSSISDVSGDKTENTHGNQGVPDYWIVKLNSSGSIQWQNTIGGNNYDFLISIQQTFDGGYILGGISFSNISGDKTENCLGSDDYWIIKISPSGSIQWQNTIGGNVQDAISLITQTPDQGYIISGFSNSGISGDKTENTQGLWDYWIIKLLPDTITSIPNLQFSNSNFQIFPNPSNGIFQINFSKVQNFRKVSCEVINPLGQTLFKSQILNPKSQINLNLSFLPKGMYVLKINDSVSALSSKFVIE
jgi:hypothetical protein